MYQSQNSDFFLCIVFFNFVIFSSYTFSLLLLESVLISARIPTCSILTRSAGRTNIYCEFSLADNLHIITVFTYFEIQIIVSYVNRAAFHAIESAYHLHTDIDSDIVRTSIYSLSSTYLPTVLHSEKLCTMGVCM